VSTSRSTSSDAGTLLWAAVVALVVTRGYLLTSFEPDISDVPFFWQNAVRAIDQQEVPYSSDFQIGYPPLAWAMMLAPRWIDPTEWSPRNESLLLGRYTRRFRAQMALFDLGAFLLLVLILRRQSASRAAAGAWDYVILTAVFGNLLYDRFDVALLFLLLLGNYCWIRSTEPDEMASSWSQLAYVVLGLCVSLKLLPVVALPLLLAGETVVRRKALPVLVAVGCWTVGALFPFLWHMPLTGFGSFGFLAHHAGRGLQVESLYASLLLCLAPLGLPVEVHHTTNAWHVESPLSHALNLFAIGVLVFWGLAFAAWGLWRGRQAGLIRVGMAASVAIAGVPILSHVLSPQYLIWATILLIWPAARLLPRHRYWLLLTLLIVVALLTTWLFPYNYFSADADGNTINPHALLPALAWQATAVLVTRNLLFLSLVGWLTTAVLRRGASSVPT